MKSEQAIMTVLCMVSAEDKILLQNRIAENWPGVTFPGGHVERDESFVEAVIREMEEETGLNIEDPKLCGIKQFQSQENERYVVLLFKTDVFSGDLRSSHEGEMKWVKRSALASEQLVPDFWELLKVFDGDQYQELIIRGNNPTLIELH